MLRKLLLSIVLSGFVTLPGRAQTKLTEYLDKEVAAVAVVSKPALFFEHVADLIGFSDEEWASVRRLATDESFGIVHPEKAISIENGLGVLTELLADVEEIGAVLHSRETGDYSIVIKATPEIHEELFLRCGKVARDILSADQPPEEVQSKFDPTKLDCFFKSCDNWIVISNNKRCGEELVARISGKSVPKRNVLRSTRKYQRVSRAMVNQDLDAPSITCYGSPEKISQWFFPDLSDSVREAYKFKEVPAIGLHIDFAPKPANQYVPNISFEFVVPFTVPRTGYGAIIDSYSPLGELPPIPFEIMQLDAYGVDSVKLHEATMKIMDEANSKNTAKSASKNPGGTRPTRKLKRSRTRPFIRR